MTYGEDLSRVHHEGFVDHPREVASMVRAMAPPPGLVVDLGCGSGVMARELVDAGYDVFGVDISAPMVELAVELVPEARFVCGSVHEVDLPADCAVVTAVGEVCNYLFDPAASLGLFSRVRAALRPGGLFLFDVAGPGRGSATPVAVREGDGWLVIAAKRERGDLLVRDITVFRRVDEVAGGHYRRSDEQHVLRLYEPAVVEQALADAGFRVDRLADRGQGWAVFAAWA